MNMEDGDRILNQVLGSEINCDEEEIVVTEFISFLQTVRAAHANEFKEMCNDFDDTVKMPFGTFIAVMKDFAKEKRNIVSGEIEESQEFQHMDSNLEGCGGDMSVSSILEPPDIRELNLRIEDLIQLNANLKEEKTELRKQLDDCEDECLVKRQEIDELQKNLRQFHGSKPDVLLLLREKDEMQNKNQNLQEEISSLKTQEKILKEERDGYKFRLSFTQDQYDKASIQIEQLRKENDDFKQENSDMKARCDNFQLSLDEKEEIILLKTQECIEVMESRKEDERMIENLQEKKDLLSDQVRELELEYSICRKVVDGSASATPLRKSIKQELDQADCGIGRNGYPSPICGSNHATSSEQISSQSLGDELLLFTVKASSSLNETISKTHKTTETEMQMCQLQAVESASPKIEIAVQTDVEMDCSESDFDTLEEVKIIDGQFFFIQEEIKKLRSDNVKLELKLDQEKCNSLRLLFQVGENGAKARSLQEDLIKEREKVAELTQINTKLCSSKLDVWWEDHEKDFTNDSPTPGGGINNFLGSSRLIDAMLLDGMERPWQNSEWDSSVLYGQGTPRMRLDHENNTDCCEAITLTSNADHMTVNCRLHVLRMCITMVEEAMVKKVELLLDMMRQVLFSDMACSKDILDTGKLSNSFVNHLRSLQSLGTKLASAHRCFGAREEEIKMTTAVKLLSARLQEEKLKSDAAYRKLRQLSDISLECKCFCALDMLSVLRGKKELEDSAFRHLRQAEEISDISGSARQREIFRYTRVLDGMKVKRKVPSRFKLMLFCFLLFAYLTFQWEDYHIPRVM